MPNNKLKKSLLTLPRIVKKGLVIFLDAFICGFTIWLTFGLISNYWGPFRADQWWVLVIAVGFSFPLFVSFGLYRAIFRYAGSAAFISIVRAFFIYTCAFFFVFTVIGLDGVPRSVGVIQPILLFIGTGLIRYFIRYYLGSDQHLSIKPFNKKPVLLLYGAGSAGRQLASILSIDKQIIIKGFIDDDPSLHGNTINGFSVYSSNDLKHLIERLDISDVILALPSVSRERRRLIISSLYGCGVRVRTLPSLTDMASGRVHLSNLHDLDMNDVLGREEVVPDPWLLKKNIQNKVVLVTGAGGTIGSELCRQIFWLKPKKIILVDNSEYALYKIYEELKSFSHESIKLIANLASVRDDKLLLKIFGEHVPDTIFHSAAYKHVSLVEENLAEGLRNNILGTFICAKAALEAGVSNFILISTDKAVRPTSVMGASKRISEMILQALNDSFLEKGVKTIFSMVRFGNVLGSSGSVAPLFSSQIKDGGPITLTHPDVTRYFMTISEAAQLVIQAGAMAKGGDVFVLDMGKPIRIYDLAKRMIYLSGLMIKDDSHPSGDIEIAVTGLRKGEKLHEELLIGNSPQNTDHPKIMKAQEDFSTLSRLEVELDELLLALDESSSDKIFIFLTKLVPEFKFNQVN